MLESLYLVGQHGNHGNTVYLSYIGGDAGTMATGGFVLLLGRKRSPGCFQLCWWLCLDFVLLHPTN